MKCWIIVCPDEVVRHPPYVNCDDAQFDAGLCEQKCNFYPNDPPNGCPRGQHSIRLEENDAYLRVRMLSV